MLARPASADGKACPAALEITSPLGVRPCRMAMASSATPQEREQLRTARWKTIAVATEDGRWHHLTHETSRPGAPVGDLPRIFTADTLSYRASLYGRRSLRSPKRSGPEWPAFSPGPADGMTGASARGPGSSQMTGGPAILPFLLQPRTGPPEGEPDCAFGPRFDSREPPISRACRTGHRRGWQSRRQHRSGWKGRAAGHEPGIKAPPLPS